MAIAREKIIGAIRSGLQEDPAVLAAWLEGSDGTKSLDDYSDIDLVVFAKEGCVQDAFNRLEAVLARLGRQDIAYEQPGRPAHNRYKVYRLEAANPYLMLDVTVQCAPCSPSFLREDESASPVVLFDHAGIVAFRSVDPASLRSELAGQLADARGLHAQRDRAVKYTKRGLFLEALIYYQRYVLLPLVNVLRIVYTPYQADAFLVHATRDFPPAVSAKLTRLYGVTTVRDIAERIGEADAWFREASAEAEELLARSTE